MLFFLEMVPVQQSSPTEMGMKDSLLFAYIRMVVANMNLLYQEEDLSSRHLKKQSETESITLK